MDPCLRCLTHTVTAPPRRDLVASNGPVASRVDNSHGWLVPDLKTLVIHRKLVVVLFFAYFTKRLIMGHEYSYLSRVDELVPCSFESSKDRGHYGRRNARSAR